MPPVSANRIYSVSLLACVAGYVWVYYALTHSGKEPGMVVCPIKQVTGFPCPSCGVTRSLVQLVHGNPGAALYLNPLGMMVGAAMLVIPCWIAADFISGRRTLVFVYNRAEDMAKKPKIAVPLVVLLMLNWFWNILKHL